MVESRDDAFLPIEEHHYFIAHGHNIYDFTFPFGGYNAFVALGQLLARFNVLIIFVNETTAQASTHARDFVRGKRDALFFCHLDRDGGEVCKEFGTTACFEPTGTHTTDDLRHVARTDLPHLDMSGRIEIVHVLFEGLEVNLFLAFGAEEESKAGTIVVVLCGDDLDFTQPELSCAGAAIDHGFGLFGLPGLEQQQIAGGSASFYGPPAAFRLRRHFLYELNNFAQMPAARSIYNHVLADSHMRDSGRVEMVNLTNFGETYTDNVWIHAVNYTVRAR